MFNDCYNRPEEFLREPPLPLYLYSVGEKTVEAGEVSRMGSLKNSFAELIWCVEGSGELTLYEKTFTLYPGDLFFYLPGEDHCHRAISKKWRTRWITFDGPLAEAYLMSFRYPRLLREGNIPSDAVFTDLKKSISDSDRRQIRRISGILCQILTNLVSKNSENSYSGQPVKRCLDFIVNHLSDPLLDVTMLCDSLHIAPSTLNRLFKEKIGESPGKVIRNRRLREAQILLLNSNMNIGEISQKCGFSDPNTFIRFIRRNLGMPPMTYRKNVIRKNGPSESI